MERKPWLVVAISGVTCGGKTTLARRLLTTLPTTTVYLGQDEYILPDNFLGHLLASSPLGGLNRDSLRSVDMNKMVQDVKTILDTKSDLVGCNRELISKIWKDINPMALKIKPVNTKENYGFPPMLLLDGYLLLNHEDIPPLCCVKFFITLTKEQCWERRKNRVYASLCRDIKMYFDLCVWPKYREHFSHMLKTVNDIIFLNGANDVDALYISVFRQLIKILEANKQIL